MRTFRSGIRAITVCCWDLCQGLPLLINPLSGKISHIPTKYGNRRYGLPSSHWSQVPSQGGRGHPNARLGRTLATSQYHADPLSPRSNHQVSRSRESNQCGLTHGPRDHHQSHHFLRLRGSPKGNLGLKLPSPQGSCELRPGKGLPVETNQPPRAPSDPLAQRAQGLAQTPPLTYRATLVGFYPTLDPSRGHKPSQSPWALVFEDSRVYSSPGQ